MSQVPEAAAVADVIDATLADREIEYTRPADDTFVVVLPGERKLKTTLMLTVGKHGVRIESFVCRKPDENFEGVYKYLLRRNRKLYGVSYTLDRVGDIYLVGRISNHAVDPDELDRIFGQVLEAVDFDFNTLLELGFAESIRKEWKWRVSRGESLKNLRAFEHLIDESSDTPQ
ncbi:YbjN domain-containing protein [Nocardia cyriacigeorgica]|uniref:YbjN domain-containing protein n=1 Tax=Nocardia cyriacigeorgica TaxID=135487 RepID=UPI000CEA1FFE|nr:YbjN domain-containing protein [Nocardia cyriacigeorgica]AVH21952.1 histidine kinase [Nocardia cyriacigeorgica]MBF6085550.1 YbjN domain-containing protein [Nocardia cyriacigeorgica]MBF6091639.1 YbjN domain-containing protein [Nocardia cyriacigeorgica]MBF6321477.1 YbjN domain-containing protein [Nocardia cyriacigeorgica]MBF6394725.1 YbjN domain-containing protein [Nocardia cyriacigeorgica]